MGHWRSCKNVDHHLHYRPGTNKWVVQFQWNKKRVSQIFDNKEEAILWRDEQLKEIKRPIFKFEQKTYDFEDSPPPLPPKEKKLKNGNKLKFTLIEPKYEGPKLVSFN